MSLYPNRKEKLCRRLFAVLKYSCLTLISELTHECEHTIPRRVTNKLFRTSRQPCEPTITNKSKELPGIWKERMHKGANDQVHVPSTKDKTQFRKRYNKLVIINLEKRAHLRDLIKHNTRCEHKQVYTQANAICRRISSSYEEDKISAEQAMNLMMEAHDKMSHHNLPKEVICDEMNKRLNKLETGQGEMAFEVTMANVSVSNRIRENQEEKGTSDDSSGNRYSESYWAEVI